MNDDLAFDVTSLKNPYDFSNPIRDKDLLIGREEEIKQIKYYLGQAKVSSKPVNLAILGERASGKTSLLNIVEHMSKELSLCVVRLNLDQGDTQEELRFFFKMYDAIFNAAIEEGAFGGFSSPVYYNYIDMISTFEVPLEKKFCPLVFPMLYASAMKKDNSSIPVSDSIITRDLQLISQEISKPIIILIDEGNVLAAHKTILQKIRNMFMNIEGFMLVLCGTTEIFTVIDDVFSPITRQFIKINIGGFKDESVTEKCISVPIEKLGYGDRDIFAVAHQTVCDIHNVSSGKPYEIQYICHHLFKRIQDGKRTEMVLDTIALQDIKHQIAKSQSVEKTALIEQFMSGESYKRAALSIISLLDGNASLEEMYNLEFVMNSNARITKDELDLTFIELRDMKLFDEDQNTGIVKFTGDQFEKIYLKYASIESGYPVRFTSALKYEIWGSQIIKAMRGSNRLGGLSILDSIRYYDFNLEQIFVKIDRLNEDSHSLADLPINLITLLYTMIFYFSESKTNYVIRVKFENRWTNGTIFFDDYNNTVDNMVKYKIRLREMQGRAGESEGRFEIRFDNIALKEPMYIIQKFSYLGDIELLESLVDYHFSQMLNFYQQKEINKSAIHCSAISAYCSRIQRNYNPVGYILILAGKYEEAVNIYNISITVENMIEERVLLLYNQAIAFVLLEKIERALEILEDAKSLSQKHGDKVNDLKLSTMLKYVSNTKTIEEFDEDIDIVQLILDTISDLQSAS